MENTILNPLEIFNQYWTVITVCVVFSILLLLFNLISNENKDAEAKAGSIKNYMKPTWKNYLFHFISGLAMLPVVVELGMPFVLWVVEKFTGLSLEITGAGLHVLAAASGLSGGYIIAKGIRFVQKLK